MADKYFVYDPEFGYESFETAEKAKEEAENRLDIERDHSPEGWSENVTQIVWGEIKQHTVMCDKRPSDNSAFDYICDYKFDDLA